MIGRTIVAIRPMTAKEQEDFYWDSRYPIPVIVLDDGSLLIASQDEEMNGPGELLHVDNDETYLVYFGKNNDLNSQPV